MEMITMQKQKKSRQTKEQVESFLNTSKEDYEKYLSTHLEDYLRDASEKLFTCAQNIIELKTGLENKNYDDFKKRFKTINIGISDQKKKELLNSLNTLHIFSRHGLLEHVELDDIVNTYSSTYNILKELI